MLDTLNVKFLRRRIMKKFKLYLLNSFPLFILFVFMLFFISSNVSGHEPVKQGVCDNNRKYGCEDGVNFLGRIQDNATHYNWECLGSKKVHRENIPKSTPTILCNFIGKAEWWPAEKVNHRSCYGLYFDNAKRRPVYKALDCNRCHGSMNRVESSVRSCSKIKPVKGKCSDQLNTCAKGSFEDVPDSKYGYKWKCNGLNGGSHNYCFKKHTTKEMRCSLKNNKCYRGVLQDVEDTDKEIRWNCVDKINASHVISCSNEKINKNLEDFTKPINGVCGVRRDGLQKGCAQGTYISTNNENKSDGWYSVWLCLGKNGGTSVSCERKKKRVELTITELGLDYEDALPSNESVKDKLPVCSTKKPVKCKKGKLHNDGIVFDWTISTWKWQCTNGESNTAKSNETIIQCNYKL